MVQTSTSIHKNSLEVLGLKQTKARIAVLEILETEKRPLDANEICTWLNEKDVQVDQATVYRILDLFHQKGLVHRLEFHEGKFRYEMKGFEHHHLICDSCGNIEDIADCDIEQFEDKILQKKGFKVKHHSLEFYGICKTCLH